MKSFKKIYGWNALSTVTSHYPNNQVYRDLKGKREAKEGRKQNSREIYNRERSMELIIHYFKK